jgi:hypothetical protein
MERRDPQLGGFDVTLRLRYRRSGTKTPNSSSNTAYVVGLFNHYGECCMSSVLPELLG